MKIKFYRRMPSKGYPSSLVLYTQHTVTSLNFGHQTAWIPFDHIITKLGPWEIERWELK